MSKFVSIPELPGGYKVDTVSTPPANGDALTFNATTGNFEPIAGGGGGGGGLAPGEHAVFVNDTPPSSPADNDLWVDTTGL